jgi:hypothetical protein
MSCRIAPVDDLAADRSAPALDPPDGARTRCDPAACDSAPTGEAAQCESDRVAALVLAKLLPNIEAIQAQLQTQAGLIQELSAAPVAGAAPAPAASAPAAAALVPIMEGGVETSDTKAETVSAACAGSFCSKQVCTARVTMDTGVEARRGSASRVPINEDTMHELETMLREARDRGRPIATSHRKHTRSRSVARVSMRRSVVGVEPEATQRDLTVTNDRWRRKVGSLLSWADQKTPIFAPNAAGRMTYGVCISLLGCAVGVLGPTHAAFGGDGNGAWDGIATALIVTDVIFLCNMFVRLRTSFFEHGALVSDSRTVALHQLENLGFFLLVFDALPLAWCGWVWGASTLERRLFLLLRCMHAFVPLGRGLAASPSLGVGASRSLVGHVNPGLLRLLQLLLLLVLCSHATGCLWWLVGTETFIEVCASYQSHVVQPDLLP